MLRVVFGNGHGCYKLGYDAVKLANCHNLRPVDELVTQAELISAPDIVIPDCGQIDTPNTAVQTLKRGC